jgi:chorismate mutase
MDCITHNPPRQKIQTAYGDKPLTLPLVRAQPVRTGSRSAGGSVEPDRGSKSSVMIEPIMYFGVGFFVAALLGLLLVPRLHNRAVRQTMRRLKAATPLSIAEIRADKDQVRAEFAMQIQKSDLGEDIENAGGRDSGTVDIFRADIRQLEGQLAVALEERSKLLCEIAAMKRDAETTWAAERVENALFRERINDVAGEVARITEALEGSGSPIGPMLADAVLEIGQGTIARAPINSASGEAGAATIDVPKNNKGALADRIRALRTMASRAASN